jgi:hypothetical protein
VQVLASPVLCLTSARNATSHIDALAVGPYFGSWSSADTNLDTFMDSKLPGQVTEALTAYVVEHAKIAARYNKPLFAYEAGQHLTGDNPLPMNVSTMNTARSVLQGRVVPRCLMQGAQGLC